jgi:hypothetical protein
VIATSEAQVTAIAATTADNVIQVAASGKQQDGQAAAQQRRGPAHRPGHDRGVERPQQGEERADRDRDGVADRDRRRGDVMAGVLDRHLEPGAHRGERGEDAVVAVAPEVRAIAM